MQFPNMPESTIIIGRFSSHCNACGQACAPCETYHRTILTPGERGRKTSCGMTWTHVTTMYKGAEKEAKEIRPDLEYVEAHES